jgi:CheY-like chemotaxis protein
MNVKLRTPEAPPIRFEARQARRVPVRRMDSDLPSVLVVDDTHDLADSLTEMLRLCLPAGFHVDIAYGGREAVAAHEGGAHQIVVMDLQMPVMDGFAAAAAIKAASAPAPLLIAVSGNEELLEHARDTHCVDHALLKPVEIDVLLALMVGA